MLSATGIHKGFDGLGVLRGIDLNVEKGEVVALIGPSEQVSSSSSIEPYVGYLVLNGVALCWPSASC